MLQWLIYLSKRDGVLYSVCLHHYLYFMTCQHNIFLTFFLANATLVQCLVHNAAFVANHMGKVGYTVAVGIWGSNLYCLASELTFLMMLSGLHHDHASSAKASMISPWVGDRNMWQYALGHCSSNNLKVVCLLNITLLYTTRSHTFHKHTLYEGGRNMPPYNLRVQ